MNHTRCISAFMGCFSLLMALFSCGETAPTQEVRMLDSLNRRAYGLRYKKLDSSYIAAKEAYDKARLYGVGKAEACNHLAFCAFMKMDFDAAEYYHKEAIDATSNELERFIADIGLMKVYQRTSMNKEYFDARTSALRRMKRINEDISVFVDAHEMERLNYAFTEFYLVTAIYHYYLQQQSEALESIGQIKIDEALQADTAQFLYYYYIKGSAGLVSAENFEEKRLKEFDNLFYCWSASQSGNYTYFEANCLQGISELLIDKRTEELLYARRPKLLQILNEEDMPDSLLPLNLAERALAKFNMYNDIYQIAGAHRTIGAYYNSSNRFDEAIKSLAVALDYVNLHHTLYYPESDTTFRLKPYTLQDTLYKEIEWINDGKIKSVPEWTARIREQLSVAYAGLGNKAASDYNRNIYLDILDYTRQDKELEVRFYELEKETQQLNMLIWLVVAGIVMLSLVFWILNSRWKARNRIHVERLKQTLEICQKITGSVPVDASDMNAISESLLSPVKDPLNKLFNVTEATIEEETDSALCEGQYSFDLKVPDKEKPVGVFAFKSVSKLSKDDLALIGVILPYIAWALDSGMMFIALGDERKRLEKERYICEKHISENKRQNLLKKSCLAIATGITPYMDRAINEVGKIKQLIAAKEEGKKWVEGKIAYIGELIAKINEYNDILALWIKMKQGTLSLNVENFALDELFEVLAKGRKTFDLKHQHFFVEPTTAVVKADKALTLFMINTLTENARKYTPEQGSISVYATEEEDYVEISVKDSGYGLDKEDISAILSEKIYDSRKIGLQTTSDLEELDKNKGSGFGLINCKGIIEKYRKTSDVFRVCLFNIESEPGKGSRFFFRLPKGIRKVWTLWWWLLPSALLASPVLPYPADRGSEYNKLLVEASHFADSAYYCNVNRDYKFALQYIDSAMNRLNRHFEEYSSVNGQLVVLKEENSPAEITWWNRGFESDYYVILDIRNEAAVAFLALNDQEGYTYNNDAYTALYKLIGEDSSLEDFCGNLQHSRNNKVVGLILCVLLLLGLFIGYYFIYFRRRLTLRRNMEQLLEINKQIFDSVSKQVRCNPEEPLSIPSQLTDDVFDSINELLSVEVLSVAFFDEEERKLHFVFTPPNPEDKESLVVKMRECFDTQQRVISSGSTLQCMPLLVDVGDDIRCVGVFAIVRQTAVEQESVHLLFELITRYMAIVVFNGVVKLVDKYRDIESAEDEVRRVSREDAMLHVQNMVLDNCLSTIKHETIYYPSRIKQILDKSSPESEENLSAGIETIAELLAYYKGIFTILCSCASRQLEEVSFRRNVIKADMLTGYALKYLSKISKRSPVGIELWVDVQEDISVWGDQVQLNFLLENLIDEAFSYPVEGVLKLSVHSEGAFVRFMFTDTRRIKTEEELNNLFYPDLNRMLVNEEGILVGTEYLLCKQIVREHDEYAGRRGCRMNAERSGQGGFTVYFTLPWATGN